MTACRYLICYDIASDALRARVSLVLSGFGTRVQYSVFEAWLTDGELGRLMRALAAMPELERGQIDVFHCRRQGAATLAGLGTQLADENARCWVFAETPSGEPHGPQGGASD